ncbi:MAG TPA: zinc-dependent metalloprotease [Bryobacteraceae bacterium]|nr:zinc-dependent metalloprotease [Bryobacteraceae bacterium]
MYRFLVSLLLSTCAATALRAQEPAEPPPAAASASPALPAGRGAAANAEPQPYEKVITKDAKSKTGVFTVHEIKDKYYYEIPKDQLNKEFLWNTQIAKTTLGAGYGGQELASRVVKWELNGNKVHLRSVDYQLVADPQTPIAQAVRAASNDTILMTFPVAAFSQNGAPVIEVTRLFSADVPEFSARQRLNATAMDASRSYIERVSPYPENIEAVATITYTRTPPPAGANAPAAAGGMRPGSATVVLHHSMVKLPEKPMMPRVFDERVGYFSENMIDYSRQEHRSPRVRYIARWRLEKKDPNAAVSEPVKPLVYYIDSATPWKWRDWMKKGVEAWQVAFEAAGFKNAIVAKLAPTPEEDPDFSPEDVRYSVIRWLPSTTENASGPHISDPRTGEILNADIQFYHNVMNLLRDWYFLQVGPLDPRARTLPLPDDLMGRLLEFVVTHEVGHTLGLQHNMKASSTYPQEKVHSAEWVHQMGAAPSIMDYARFNYVAQPEDRIPVEDLTPRIGPYDIWAIKWGYTPIPGAKTADEEKPALNQWSRQQDTTPWYRFSTAAAAGSDPGELTEAIGDADAIQSTALGLKNLQRVAKMLIPATTAKAGEPFDDLAELYGRMLGQWTLEMNHVTAIVGGFNSQQKHAGQDGLVFVAVPRDRQKLAVRFLQDNAFTPPMWAVDPQILRRIQPVGVLSSIRNAQNSVLTNLLSSPRFNRLVEQEALDRAFYAPSDFLADVRKGIWKELNAPQVRIGAYRRNLQRAYLDLANTKINANPSALPAGLSPELAAQLAGSGEERPLYRAELKTLRASLQAAIPKAADRETRAHLEAARDQIAKILDPRFAPAPASAGPVLRIAMDAEPPPEGAEVDPLWALPGPAGLCWRDYVIRP